MGGRPVMTRVDAKIHCAFVALVAFACTGRISAAALAPAPAIVQPFVVVLCIGSAMLAASELPDSIAVLRATRTPRTRRRWELAELRRQLDELPETEHPLGL